MCLNYLYNLATDRKKGLYHSIAKFFLFILSVIYGILVRLLISINSGKQLKFSCKVISVGNITLGGTGKTSLVEIIACYLKDNGHKVAIISRGYGRQQAKGSGQQASLPDRQAGYLNMGDEPYMLSLKLKDVPVIVSPDRASAIKSAIQKYGADTVILDDGFQQWKIKKDLDIVVLNSNNPFGNRYLLPRGILREPVSCLTRANLFVINQAETGDKGQDLKNFLYRLNPQSPVFKSKHIPLGFYKIDEPETLLNAGQLKPEPVACLCAIGNPEGFQDLLRSQGFTIGLSFQFRDHFHYKEKDLKAVFRKLEELHIDTIITTEKDAVRINSVNFKNYPVNIFVLKVRLRIIENEQGFYNRLLKLYSA